MKKLFVLVVALATIGLFPARPALADNAYVHGWWGQPPVVISDNQYTGNVQDAAYYWQDRGFNGYYPPLPGVPLPMGAYCAGDYEGYITVCTVSRSIIQAYCNGNCDGHTRTYFYIGSNRIHGGFILIADDLSPYRRQQVWRHEFGHALGLGHTYRTNCVMYATGDVPLGNGCDHDISEMNKMYPALHW